MKIAAFLVVALLCAQAAFAADVDGKWVGNFTTPNGDVEVGFTFKADGTTLTGTSTGPDGSTLQIKNGKIDGNKISFSFDLDMGQGPMTFDYTGVVSPTEVKLHSDFMGNAIDFTLTKAK